MAQSRVFYLCDGERENCKRNMCYKNGGDCKHTKDIRHAKNFSRKYCQKYCIMLGRKVQVFMKMRLHQKNQMQPRQWRL